MGEHDAGTWVQASAGPPEPYRLCDVALRKTGVPGTDDTEPCWRFKHGTWYDNQGRILDHVFEVTHWRYSAYPKHPEHDAEVCKTPTQEQRAEARDVLGFKPATGAPDDLTSDLLAQRWVDSGGTVGWGDNKLSRLPAVAQALADRDGHIAQAQERVMALASALQDVTAAASNLYAWDWSHHLADSKGGDDVRKELRALERASVAARPLLKQLREELHESCVEEWRRSEKSSAVEGIDWLKYAKYSRKR